MTSTAPLTSDNIRLSKPLAEAKDHYDAIVVGSGYGAAVSASRLARTGLKVAVLERGQERRPGEYPRTLPEVMDAAQITVQQSGQVLGKRDAMVDFRLNGDMSVVLGCGLGGTSLINANVALEIDTRLHDYFNWPKIYCDKPDLLDPYFERARQGLGSNPYPEDGAPLPKVAALKQSAAAIDQPFTHPPINITFKDGKNHFGFEQLACTNCGDCCTGCNYRAKNTTLMNYLPDARAWGADIICGAEVTHLDRDGHWQVHLLGRDAPITAETVVLGAGSLGSTEILLRTAQKTKLRFSDQLGKRFSGNGDVLAFGYNANLTQERSKGDDRPQLHGVGAGAHAPDSAAYQPGPCIAGLIDIRHKDRPVTEGMVIEEGILPGPLSMAWSAIFFMNDATAGNMFQFGDTALRVQDAATIGAKVQSDPTGLADWSYKGPIGRTQTYLVMSHDASDGTITLDNGTGRAGIVWPGVGRTPTYVRDNQILRDAAEGMWAEYMPNPAWSDPMGNKLVTVHPIGGCVMADTPEDGVTNAYCEVYDPTATTGVADHAGQPIHPGLLVCDGAIVPGALGVNPLLTISALTEHAIEALCTREGWTLDLTTNKDLPAECHVTPAQVPDAPAGLSVGFMLMAAIAALTDIKGKVDKGDLAEAKTDFISAYKMIYSKAGEGTSLPSPDTLDSMLTEHMMKADIGPVIDEFLPPLKELSTAINAGNYGDALKILREAMGDFSPGLSFKETMHGFLSKEGLDRDHPISDAYKIANRNGELAGDSIIGHFEIATDSLDKMLSDRSHTADLSGTIDCKTLNTGSLTSDTFTLHDAKFMLFQPQDDQVECWYMIYTGRISNGIGGSGVFGDTYHFHGYKTLQRREGSNWWGDTTTLAIDIRADEDSPVLYRGVMTLNVQDLATQISTVEEEESQLTTWQKIKLGGRFASAMATDSLADLLADKDVRATIIKELMVAAAAHGHPGFGSMIKENYLARFGALFAMLIFRSYGGVLSYLQNFPRSDNEARHAAIAHTPLQRKLPAPKPSHFVPESGPNRAKLQLTRYTGGDKGPVILAPGFGVTADSFVMNTTDVSLTEYLCHKGYDVWLFDYRGSPALEATRQPFTIDDIAREDWPAAVKMVQTETGKDVQVIAHCVASMALLMSLLDGLGGVKSVISSQTTLHPVTSWVNYAKADMHLASLLKDGVPKSMDGMIDGLGLPDDIADLLKNGMPTVNMSPDYVEPGPDSPQPVKDAYLREKAIDLLLFNAPFPDEMPCSNPVCHRVFGVFGASYVHDQLNEATHNALADVFGEVSSTPFLQLATIMRAGLAVDQHGQDVYMTKPENIRIPIDFIAGSRNQIFYPETSLRTYDWLLQNHPKTGKSQFSRHVFRSYAHMDIFIGKNALDEVYPYLLEQLENRA